MAAILHSSQHAPALPSRSLPGTLPRSADACVQTPVHAARQGRAGGRSAVPSIGDGVDKVATQPMAMLAKADAPRRIQSRATRQHNPSTRSITARSPAPRRQNDSAVARALAPPVVRRRKLSCIYVYIFVYPYGESVPPVVRRRKLFGARRRVGVAREQHAPAQRRRQPAQRRIGPPQPARRHRTAYKCAHRPTDREGVGLASAAAASIAAAAAAALPCNRSGACAGADAWGLQDECMCVAA